MDMGMYTNQTTGNITGTPFYAGDGDIPVLILTNILLGLGIVGNCHVFFIYLLRFKSSVYRMFILILALVDFWTCVIEVPYFTMLHTNAFVFVFSCQTFNFICATLTAVSSLTLIFIAVDRYRRVCRPLQKQWTINHVRIGCLIIAITAVIILAFETASFGLVPVLDESNRFLGYRCGFKITQSWTARAISFVSVLVTVCLMVTTGVLYGLMTKHLIRRKRLFEFVKHEKTVLGLKQSFKRTIKSIRHGKENKTAEAKTEMKNQARESMEDGQERSSHMSTDCWLSHHVDKYRVNSCKERGKLGKSVNITIMFGVATLVSYLCILIYVVYRKVLLRNFMQPKEPYWILIVSRVCQILNNVVNPYVYCIVNKKVAQECKLMYLQLFGRIRRVSNR